ncbi:hypothetical protein Dform_00517 [Dehalogenimonas formicexedens]|uniref:IrrE N-terminal-like domain-containing protein n=1 Tax=Dehalogenimonas formicexedens TaxID=1839801 RepID=A0A1P8F6A3_9CHLR|nr:ImmA/IrrE family metallo-endopeptidase [Dehalogenimonas formicexedens]APV43872.1 hypothetical protein Dform_00517 [Dehalogenimonas formicexedens]
MSETLARQLAIETRLKLGLQSIEYLDVLRSIEAFNICCIKRPLESSISGATVKTQRVRCIFVNSSKTLGHQHFTIAHELFHCLCDTELVNRLCKTEQLSNPAQNEELADLFAKHLLMPEDGILYQLMQLGIKDKPLTLSNIVNLEQFFGVSRRSMCRRLEGMKLISRDETNNFCLDVISGVLRLGKPVDLYKPTNDKVLISDYAAKAQQAFDCNLITASKYEEILADADLLDIINQEDTLDVVD